MGELGERIRPFLSPGLCINEAFMGVGVWRENICEITG